MDMYRDREREREREREMARAETCGVWGRALGESSGSSSPVKKERKTERERERETSRILGVEIVTLGSGRSGSKMDPPEQPSHKLGNK